MPLQKRFLIKWANQAFDFMTLVRQAGYENADAGDLVYCIFHPDREGGKRSAKIFKDALHCFSCGKQYRQYDFMIYMGYTDAQIEATLRATGSPPDDLYLYEDKRINVVESILPLKTKFIKGEIGIVEYTQETVKGIYSVLEGIKHGDR